MVEFVRSCWCSFVFSLKPSVICILVYIRLWVWFESASLCEESVELDTSSRQTGSKPSFFQCGHDWCALKGPESIVMEMQLVCTVLSEFRHRGVDIYQRLSEVVFVSVQCGQCKHKPSWCCFSGLSELYMQHIPSRVGNTSSCQHVQQDSGTSRHR